MYKKILLTSFQTWLPHQKSNSADDLLYLRQNKNLDNSNIFFLRQLPVDISQASEIVIKKIEDINPDVIICCGMAESRTFLTVESNACHNNQQLYTKINLQKLISHLEYTKISHDAGKFVCEGLYYRVLKEIDCNYPQKTAIFLHIPILNEINTSIILKNLQSMIKIFQSSNKEL